MILWKHSDKYDNVFLFMKANYSLFNVLKILYSNDMRYLVRCDTQVMWLSHDLALLFLSSTVYGRRNMADNFYDENPPPAPNDEDVTIHDDGRWWFDRWWFDRSFAALYRCELTLGIVIFLCENCSIMTSFMIVSKQSLWFPQFNTHGRQILSILSGSQPHYGSIHSNVGWMVAWMRRQGIQLNSSASLINCMMSPRAVTFITVITCEKHWMLIIVNALVF